MAISKTEGWALGGVTVVHILLFVALSFSLTRADPPPPPPPIAVEIMAEVAPIATAPEISSEEPAPALGDPDEPPVPPEPEPEPAPPQPVPPPPAPEPDRVRERQAEATARREREAREARERDARTERQRQERAERERTERAERERQARAERERQARAERERQARAEAERRRRQQQAANNPRPSGALEGIAQSVANNSQGTRPNPPATQSAAQVRQSIQVAVDREIAPFWQRNVPTGVDVERLRVTLEIRLNRDGSVGSVRQVGDLSGQTESNAPQQALFVERAIRSVRQAGPFTLPTEYYDQWAVVRQTFRATR
jgi:periplasmic protein TonB